MITEPGIYKMELDEYLSDPCPTPSLSSGTAFTLLYDSPNKAWFENSRLNPNYTNPVSNVMNIGSAAHSVLLEGKDIVHIVHSDSWRTNAAKAERDAAIAEGRIPLLIEDYDVVRDMVAEADKYLAYCELGLPAFRYQGDSELSLFWQEGAVWCRVRPDWWSHDRKIMLSYKTMTTSAHPSKAERFIESKGWDIAAALYAMGGKAVSGVEPTYLYLLQEQEQPYQCSLVGLTPQYLDLGRQKVKEAIHIWGTCLLTDEWPSYPLKAAWIEPKPYTLANWESKRFDLQVEEIGSDPI